jgi:hypothetical protein
MDNLEDRQREMRERNAQKKREKRVMPPETAASEDSPEVVRLKKQISQLQAQVSALQVENNHLRQQKTIVVERSSGQGRSYGDSVKEQQHNFFKYSNVRRY